LIWREADGRTVATMNNARPAARLRRTAVGGLAVTLLVAGCASATHGHHASAAAAMQAVELPTAQRACAPVADQTLTGVGQRIYDEAAGGAVVANVTRRLDSSSALARAVARDDPATTRRAVARLLKNQVERLVVFRGSRVLTTVGHARALAPVTRTLRDATGAPVGTYRVAVASDAAIAGEINAVTGAGVAVDVGGRSIVGAGQLQPTTAGSAVLGTAFSGQPLRIVLTMPAASAAECGANPGQTRALTLTSVAQRLFRAETSGAATRRVANQVAHDPRLVRAVAEDNPTALRAEIVHLFRDRSLHVVRIRAVTATGRLVNDVGGPYVLAPTSRVLRSGGRDVGTVTLSVQDDTGYIKLIHRFTGAQVQLSTPGVVVPGSDTVLAAAAAARTTFNVEAFPSGPLTVILVS
jgi:hypothetical protein